MKDLTAEGSQANGTVVGSSGAGAVAGGAVAGVADVAGGAGGAVAGGAVAGGAGGAGGAVAGVAGGAGVAGVAGGAGGAHATLSQAATIEMCTAAHRRLNALIETIDDVVIRRPSLLPGWSIAHVLTHLARNADSLVRILEAAAAGQTVLQYPGGAAQRTGDIEGGSTRNAPMCINDVKRSSERLENAFNDATQVAWQGHGLYLNGYQATCADLPFRRWREVEFHLADLGLGYQPSDWPEVFVSMVLADTLKRLPERVASASQRASLLAWFAGRSDSPGNVDFGPF